MNDSIIFYRSFMEAASVLPAEEYKEAVSAVLSYGLDGIEPENLSPYAKMFFLLAKPQIDANNARREAGRRGGEAKRDNAKSKNFVAKSSNATVCYTETDKQNVANANANANANVNAVKEKEEKEKTAVRKTETLNTILEERVNDERLKETYKDFVRMRSTIKKPLTNRALKMVIDKVEQLEPKDIKKQIAVLEQSIMNSWQGVFALKDGFRIGGNTSYQSRAAPKFMERQNAACGGFDPTEDLDDG